MANDILREMLEILPRLGELGLHPLHLLAVLVDVEKGNAPDAHREQPLDVRAGQLPRQLPAERLETLVHRGNNRLVAFAGLDSIVNTLLDQNALQRAEVQFVLELLLL